MERNMKKSKQRKEAAETEIKSLGEGLEKLTNASD
jgi:hypothetical protein